MSEGAGGLPTVVLVHGAFVDGGSFGAVVGLLLEVGVSVQAVGNPLRGLAVDSAYVASAINQISAPVLAVGHSYGGAVITNAATRCPNIAGLVFVSGFAPEEGETLGQVERRSRDSDLGSALQQRQYPAGFGDETAVELYVTPGKFGTVLAGDLPAPQVAVLAASQRPVAAAVFTERSGVPAWKTLPSWAVVATGDRAAGFDVVLSMARRARADIVELEGSHLIMVSQPRAVTAVILTALASVAAST